MLPPKDEIKRSKYLSKQLENELRGLVIDAGPGRRDADEPQLIVMNPDSCCHGAYHVGRRGVEFFFHHDKWGKHRPCACFVKGGPKNPTLRLPPELDAYRIRLIEGHEPIRMEPLYAAMVIMKIFLGMDLPEEIQPPVFG